MPRHPKISTGTELCFTLRPVDIYLTGNPENYCVEKNGDYYKVKDPICDLEYSYINKSISRPSFFNFSSNFISNCKIPDLTESIKQYKNEMEYKNNTRYTEELTNQLLFNIPDLEHSIKLYLLEKGMPKTT